jgi:hypothetical protein
VANSRVDRAGLPLPAAAAAAAARGSPTKLAMPPGLLHADATAVAAANEAGEGTNA